MQGVAERVSRTVPGVARPMGSRHRAEGRLCSRLSVALLGSRNADPSHVDFSLDPICVTARFPICGIHATILATRTRKEPQETNATMGHTTDVEAELKAFMAEIAGTGWQIQLLPYSYATAVCLRLEQRADVLRDPIEVIETCRSTLARAVESARKHIFR